MNITKRKQEYKALFEKFLQSHQDLATKSNGENSDLFTHLFENEDGDNFLDEEIEDPITYCNTPYDIDQYDLENSREQAEAYTSDADNALARLKALQKFVLSTKFFETYRALTNLSSVSSDLECLFQDIYDEHQDLLK